MMKRIVIAALAGILILLGLTTWRTVMAPRPAATVASHPGAEDAPTPMPETRTALQFLYDAEAERMRATRVIVLPPNCRAATNDNFTVTKTIDRITLQGARVTVTIADRTAVTAQRQPTGKTVVIEHLSLTEEEWQRDTQGQWERTSIRGLSSQRREDGRVIEPSTAPWEKAMTDKTAEQTAGGDTPTRATQPSEPPQQ